MINFEIIRFLRAVYDRAGSLVIFDVDAQRAQQFAQRCQSTFVGVETRIAASVQQVLSECLLSSFATTALEPHVLDLSCCADGSTILHISLRDISPAAILSADNVVDDIDHVCRAQTSIHLAEQSVGHRGFIRSTLPEILIGAPAPRARNSRTCIFSPFGLGILDLAVSNMVYSRALTEQRGNVIEAFHTT